MLANIKSHPSHPLQKSLTGSPEVSSCSRAEVRDSFLGSSTGWPEVREGWDLLGLQQCPVARPGASWIHSSQPRPALDLVCWVECNQVRVICLSCVWETHWRPRGQAGLICSPFIHLLCHSFNSLNTRRVGR